jgi:hypothetical protein
MDTAARHSPYLDADAFLRTDQSEFGSAWRYELVRGTIVAHAAPSLDFSNAIWSERCPGPLSGIRAVCTMRLTGYPMSFAACASKNVRLPVMRVHQGARQHGDEQAWGFRCVLGLKRS